MIMILIYCNSIVGSEICGKKKICMFCLLRAVKKKGVDFKVYTYYNSM